MKIVSIVGARPQFIKVKPISDQLRKHKVTHIVIHTGQHYDYRMSKIFFEQLDIPEPEYNLGVGSCFPGKQTGLMLEKIEEVLIKEKPDIVMVYGDTNSTLAGALATAKLNIPIAHVEAGLRSYRQDMPEEVNRVLTDHISRLLFCPTRSAVDNLKKEGIVNNVYLVGDVMYDILKLKVKNQRLEILQKFRIKPKEYFLLTIHRKQNTDNTTNLRSIISALKQVKGKIVFPIHPRTRKALKQNNITIGRNDNFLIVDPLGYLDMLTLEKNADKIITDSGGVQKEAYWLNVPCVTLREETEWVETLDKKSNILVGSEVGSIVNSVGKAAFKLKSRNFDIHINAAKRIVNCLIDSYKLNKNKGKIRKLA